MAENARNNDRLWTAKEVAEYLRISEGTVRQWVKEGRLPVVKVGSLNRYRREDIDAWLEKQAHPAEEVA